MPRHVWFLLAVIASTYWLSTRCEGFSSSSPVSSQSTSYGARSAADPAIALGWRQNPALLPLKSTPDGTESSEKETQLTPEKVAEMVEVSFVNACLQLAQGYVDVLKLLIVAIKAGYEMNMTPLDIINRVDAILEPTAGRPLMPEEVQLRNTWIQLVFLVLKHLNHQRKLTEGTSAEELVLDANIAATYENAVTEIQERRGDGKVEFHVDNLLQELSFDDVQDPIQKAIISQSLRVIWLTYTVLDEEATCLDEKSGLKAQPPIPGAFD